MSRKAQRAAFNAISETCPKVDAAFYDMIDQLEDLLEIRLNTEQYNLVFEKCKDTIKEQTVALRDALISSYEEKEYAEEESEQVIESLKEKIYELENRIEN